MLGWGDVAAVGGDPMKTVRGDVKKMVRSGIKSLKRSVETELEAKAEEAELIDGVVDALLELAENTGETEFPTEITFERTAKSGTTKFKTATETLSLNDAEEAARAAKKIEKSIPRWDRIRTAAIEDLHEREKSLADASRNLSELVDSWRGLMKEVLVVMH